MMSGSLILLSNDDGYRSDGIRVLRDALAQQGHVVVCAPANEQSAASHSLTVDRALRLVAREPGVFSVDGTPADCVYVALHGEQRVLPRRPDLVISGLNDGVNLGADVFYSGTVAAAREGALRGIPSLAVSAAPGADRAQAARLSVRIARAMLQAAFEEALLLNVNFPPGLNWSIRTTRLGRRVYQESVEFRTDPRGKEYLWIGGPGAEHEPGAGTDTEAFDEGVVGITPLVLDLWSRTRQPHAQRIVDSLESGTATTTSGPQSG